MEGRSPLFGKTRSFCIAILGIAIFARSCESKVDPPQPTSPAVTAKPPQCSFNHINYNVVEIWNPFLLPKGYYRCKRCICKLSSDGALAIIDCEGRRCRKPSSHANPAHNEQQSNCSHQGTLRSHGTVWKVSTTGLNVTLANHCMECSCTDSFVTCAIRTCPVLSCVNQTNTDGTCCPVCAESLPTLRNPLGCQTMGRYYDHMESWYPRRPPRYDMCINCTCKNTSIECSLPECPKITCVNPQRKPGDCCETCPETPKLDCEWNNKSYAHNSSFNPVVGNFGPSYCVTCFCNANVIKCRSKSCPTSYPCKDPVYVQGKCCKVCEDSPGNHTNGRNFCSAGKHWLVYEYIKIPRNQQKNASEVREQFALEHKDHDTVEIHTIYANMTAKVIKTTNTTKSQFHGILKKNGKDYKILGKIREVQKNKIKTWEQRACHHTQGCIHTVRKIMKGLYERVRRCGDHATSGPPQTLLQLQPENP